MDILTIQHILLYLLLLLLANTLCYLLESKTTLVLGTICVILFFISIIIDVQCDINGTNKETLIYAVDLPSVPDDDSELEISEKTITAKNGETIKVPAETIDIGKVITTDDKSKVGVYEVKKYWKCFYSKEHITYVYKPKERK